MIKSQDKAAAAARALQVVVTKARSYAYDQAPYDKIADILDRAEYLAALICEEHDQTVVFRGYLEEAAKLHACMNALAAFDAVK